VSTETRPSPKLGVAKDITLSMLDEGEVYIAAIKDRCEGVGISRWTAERAIALVEAEEEVVRSRNGAGDYLRRAKPRPCRCDRRIVAYDWDGDAFCFKCARALPDLPKNPAAVETKDWQRAADDMRRLGDHPRTVGRASPRSPSGIDASTKREMERAGLFGEKGTTFGPGYWH
jgi:hypothetical protein